MAWGKRQIIRPYTAKEIRKVWELIIKERESGDYKNLLKVFNAEFGTVVDLYK